MNNSSRLRHRTNRSRRWKTGYDPLSRNVSPIGQSENSGSPYPRQWVRRSSGATTTPPPCTGMRLPRGTAEDTGRYGVVLRLRDPPRNAYLCLLDGGDQVAGVPLYRDAYRDLFVGRSPVAVTYSTPSCIREGIVPRVLLAMLPPRYTNSTSMPW